jgi:hypothetical protein
MHIQNEKMKSGLLVVSGQEHGKIYTIDDGAISLLEHVVEHPPEYSDNEGFFMRSGDGMRYGSGNPREEDDKRNLDRYINSISSELSDIVANKKPEQVLVLEPEHLKGLIEEHLTNPTDIPVDVIDHGNFVDSPLEDLIKKLESHGKDEHDPADPASVEGEENAEEKRKILETGQMLDNQ